MTQEQAQKILDELQEVRPEKLNNEAKELFEVIMKIADERDKLKQELEQKNKQVDLMAEWIEKHTKYYDEDGCYCEVEKDICNKNIECEYCIKQYFKKKVESEDK